MSNFYVYGHYTKDTNELFYIGKGRKNRYLDTSGRNNYWHKIVKKHDFEAKILIGSLDEATAFIQEILAIKEFSPRANFTKGGAGGYTGPNEGNFSVGHRPWNTGKKCDFISKRQLGSDNPMYGKPSPHRKKIKCLNDGRIFPSVTHAYETYGICKRSVYDILSGKKESVKNLRFVYV